MKTQRPYPPDVEGFAPACEVRDWLRTAILDESGPLFNPDHLHLQDATLEVLWAAMPCRRQGNEVIGMLEIPNVQGHQWLKARMEHQLTHWFGEVPRFLMTLSALWCAEADDASFCALVEHELYHGGHARDEFGMPKYRRDGMPVFCIQGHDVEEHVGVIRRYGFTDTGGKVRELVEAANRPPLISPARVAFACGTCERLPAR